MSIPLRFTTMQLDYFAQFCGDFAVDINSEDYLSRYTSPNPPLYAQTGSPKCERCNGMGFIRYELGDVNCDVCNGMGYR